MTEYERGRKDLADEIIRLISIGIEYAEEYSTDYHYGKAKAFNEVKQYIQELIKEN